MLSIKQGGGEYQVCCRLIRFKIKPKLNSFSLQVGRKLCEVFKRLNVLTRFRNFLERLEARLEQFLSELGELQKRRQRKENLIKGENIKNEMLKVGYFTIL